MGQRETGPAQNRKSGKREIKWVGCNATGPNDFGLTKEKWKLLCKFF
jgi:hypothetical protein